MGSIRLALRALLLSAFATTAHAATHWICSVSSAGTQLICLADVEVAQSTATQGSVLPLAVVNGQRFPLDPARTYHVDMWTPPTDADFVAQLASATICYRSPACKVTLAPGPWLAAAARR